MPIITPPINKLAIEHVLGNKVTVGELVSILVPVVSKQTETEKTSDDFV